MQIPDMPDEFKGIALQLLTIGYAAGFSATDENCHAGNISQQDITEDAAEFSTAIMSGNWA